VLVGARRPLIAFNVELLTGEVEVARAIAAVVREKGGGFPGVRALGLALPSRGTVQVSMNVEDPERVHLHEVVARIRAEAAAREVEAGDSELVGLLPAGVAAAASRGALGLPELDASRLLEVRLLADGELS
jgi:glutamate formiminotransferase